ncbi:phosphatase PAP2 family protein [Nocardiopsis sp. HNM0947]|uniref:Phosphatase PAP2 family protein n=1 Tax=Nocardiopsis coralli TaxID=2772213 RepID=A0ABR9P4L2_9ACTN|nr:phosphatase PAP2 family protein [Nocardiopsis coralli]MBE2998778.1 phosphatase PAP2 family protein [Nocardiopsis coralli]
MISEIFAVSAAWSRSVIEFADGLDPWVQGVAEFGTDLLLVAFAVLFLAAWWRARSLGSRTVGLALFAPVATVVAYMVSRTIKAFFEQLRPCQAMTDLSTIATCDPIGDWSFPSNHAAIAGAAAAAIVITWHRMALPVAVLAVLEAFSRVLVGAHYPHDVTVGLIVGATVATLVSLAMARPLTGLVDRLAEVDRLRPLLRAEDAPRPAEPAEAPAPGSDARV